MVVRSASTAAKLDFLDVRMIGTVDHDSVLTDLSLTAASPDGLHLPLLWARAPNMPELALSRRSVRLVLITLRRVAWELD